MADYFETEEVVKEYDSKITARILSYLKPYKTLIAATAVALVFSTLGELLVPLLQQKVIDDAIIVRFYSVKPEAFSELETSFTLLSPESKSALNLFLKGSRNIETKELVFVPMERNTRVSQSVEKELREKNILDGGEWYAFRFQAGSPAEEVVKSRPDIFIMGENTAGILKKDLYSLPVRDIASIRSGDISFIVRTVIVLLFILCLVFFLTFIQTWGTTLVSQRILKDIRLELFRKTCSQSTTFLSKHPVGRIVTRLTGDVETIDEFFSTVLVSFLKDVSVMIGVLITLFVLSSKLALAALVTMPPVLVLTAISRIKARDAFRRQRTASSRVNSYLSERLSGVQVVQLFLGEKKSRREFSGRNNELLRAKLGEMYVFAIFRPVVELFSTITTAVIISVGAVMVLDLSLSLGVLIASINLIGMFYSPVMDIAEKYTLLQSAMAGGERVFKLMDTDERIPDAGKRPVEGMIRGHIEFDNVRFSYNQNEEVLRGLTFSVNPGEMAAIVGYTGAGKTTITNVLARLWDIDSGEIRLDGLPVKDIPLEELRRSCLPVLQDVFLFSGTVADNIRLGLPISDAEVEDAAKAVHAHEFVSRLENGYATILSEGATNISAGQRQLISFARVIAHNPAIVILDEATSSVDTETERLIQLGMQRVLAGRTSIVIAHRLSTIRHADRILVLSAGRLAEQGKHDELIAKNGLYSGLYRLQYESGYTTG
ncbi:MAG: ABC transporter ATP-binding protein/permease [Treponema sp.]|jgi:ATP-binding cassette subfamily B protein|nr:ABC transporter ATP-binding protein/permease [Treponema sp.]